ncbi:uncharacterized protein LOC144452118 isoform X2 [Glandiceps talaboti]
MVRTRVKVRKFIGTIIYFMMVGVLMFLLMFYFESKNDVAGKYKTSSVLGVNSYMHIVTASDANFFQGIPTLINSVRTTSKFSSRIKFHIVVCGDESVITSLWEYLECHGISRQDENIDILSFESYRYLDEETRYAWDDMFRNRRLRSDCNYARTYIYRLLPDVKRIIYLDVDVVAKEPVENLWRIAAKYNSPLLAVDNNKTFEDDGFQLDLISKIYSERYGRQFTPSSLIFNGGVLVIDLDFFRKYQMVNEVEYWVHQFSTSPVRLWRFDCQSIFQIVYHELWVKLDHKWNCRGLGRSQPRTSESLEAASILHWSAQNKPWTGIGPHVDIWESYRPQQCSNRGVCHNNPNATGHGYWQCICHANYIGSHCQIPGGLPR